MPPQSGRVCPASYLSNVEMITSAEIKNFRGFKNLSIKNIAPINVIVGDSGTGKTALLEAIFLACCNNPSKAMQLRMWRGLEGRFSGDPGAILEAIFSDIFYEMNFDKPASVQVKGQGEHNRRLEIARGSSDIRIPVEKRNGRGSKAKQELETGRPEIVSPVEFRWTDHQGRRSIAATKFSEASGFVFESASKNISNCYFFAAQAPVPAIEAAEHFSALNKALEGARFKQEFLRIFDWIEDLTVQSLGGVGVIHAAIKGLNRLIPLASVSGGINRTAAILATIAFAKKGIVLADEPDSGVYFKSQGEVAKALIAYARRYKTQLFLTTHSAEWLDSFVEAAGNKLDDIAMWRMVRNGRDGPEIERLGGKTFKAVINSRGEAR